MGHCFHIFISVDVYYIPGKGTIKSNQFGFPWTKTTHVPQFRHFCNKKCSYSKFVISKELFFLITFHNFTKTNINVIENSSKFHLVMEQYYLIMNLL